MNKKQIRSAFYAWGGPGTVRLLKTKYFYPSIDEQSFLTLYNKKRDVISCSVQDTLFPWITIQMYKRRVLLESPIYTSVVKKRIYYD